MLATNILLSGNNYAKIALLFKFLNMGVVERSTFFRIQDAYCLDVIKDFWHDKRAEVVSRLQSKDSVVVLGKYSRCGTLDNCLDNLCLFLQI